MTYPKFLIGDTDLANRLSDFFTAPFIGQLARTSDFVSRSSSRLTGQMFLLLNMFDADGGEHSLSDQCDYLEEHFNVMLTKQSLSERYNSSSVAFMEACYTALVSQVLNPNLTLLDALSPTNTQNALGHFNGIELLDATSFRLPDHMSSTFKGNGKLAASVKIQHRYELIQGTTLGLKIVPGNQGDTKYLAHCETQLLPKRLYIKDLGYYLLSHFDKIDKADAYFLSRYKVGTTCFIKDESGVFKSVTMRDLVPADGENKEIEELYIGAQKIKVRMILESVPPECVEQRTARTLKNNLKNDNKTIHEDALLLCAFNIYITNTSATVLPAQSVRLLYALRWQIELMFKIWKSIFNIDKIGPMNIYRLQCHLYGCLMAILLSAKIQNLFKDYLWQEQDIEISEYKCAAIIKKN